MEEQIPQKPKAVKVISWFLIFVAVFSLLSSTFSLSLLESVESKYQMFSNTTLIFFYIYGLLYATVLLVSGIQFLRLRSWARSSLEILSWLYIITISAEAIYYVTRENFYVYQILIDSGIDLDSTLKAVVMVIYLMIKGIGVAIAAVILKHLRSATVRNAMIH